MNARAMLEQAVAENASDIFLVAGRPLSLRKNGVLSMENEERLLPDDTAAFLKEIYELADNRDMRSLLSHGDDDFSCYKYYKHLKEKSKRKKKRYTLCCDPCDHFPTSGLSYAGNPGCDHQSRSGRKRNDTDHRSCRKRKINNPCLYH